MTHITANGSSPTSGIPVERGTYGLSMSGTFGTAVVTPQQRIDGTNWQTFIKSDGSTLTFTAPQTFVIDLMGCQIQYVTASADSTCSIFVTGGPVGTFGGGQNRF